jgi:hypothetical protein
MKIYIHKIAFATILTAGSLCSGQTTIDIKAKVAVATCLRGNCPVTINAVGDKVHIDLSKYKITDLGTLTAEKEVTLDLPTVPGEMKIYSFTPSEGDLAGTKVHVAFDNQQARAGSRFSGLNIVKVHRHAEGEKEWTEAGSFSGKDQPSTWVFTAYPNGDFKTFSPEGKKEVTFELGAGELKKK